MHYPSRATRISARERIGTIVLKDLARRTLARLDVGVYRLSRQPRLVDNPNIDALPSVDHIVDVGVAYGTPWLYDAYPEADLLLVDPLPRTAFLKDVLGAREHTYVEAACGATAGEAEITEDLGHPGRSSLLARTELTATGARTRTRTVAVRTLDSIVAEHVDPTRTLGVKLDTEGYELEVLRGAEETLARAAFVISEVSVQKRFGDSYSFEELVGFMNERGFRVAEILEAPPNAEGRIMYVDIAFLPH